MTLFVLAPHPDDESIGCGGMLRLAAEAGKRTVVVFLTSGEAGIQGTGAAEAARTREVEAESAAGVLGVARTIFLRGRDAHLAEDIDRLAPMLRDVWTNESPEEVHLPHPRESHPDHAAAAQLLLHAKPAGADPILVGYEVWSPLQHPHGCIDITTVMEAKLAAIRCHASQLLSFRYDAAAEGLATYRGALWGGCRFAEAFEYTWLPDLGSQA